MARVPLADVRPSSPAPDSSSHLTVNFESSSDGRPCSFDVYWPAGSEDAPLSVVIAPHPIGWTAAEEYWSGLPGLVRGFSRGWRGLAHALKLAIVLPHGHHRSVPLCSLGYPPQIADFLTILERVDRSIVPLDWSRVYAAGLSMGAQEALLFAGRNPDLVAAACVFNPIVDLAAWHDDLVAGDDPDIARFRTPERIRSEVGGSPGERPAEYRERSPLSAVEGLARVPTMILWSRWDAVVPHQAERHALALYTAIKAVSPDAPVCEFDHTRIHGLAEIERKDGWRLHEWCDYELAANWLLRHCNAAVVAGSANVG